MSTNAPCCDFVLHERPAQNLVRPPLYAPVSEGRPSHRDIGREQPGQQMTEAGLDSAAAQTGAYRVYTLRSDGWRRRR